MDCRLFHHAGRNTSDDTRWVQYWTYGLREDGWQDPNWERRTFASLFDGRKFEERAYNQRAQENRKRKRDSDDVY